MTDIPQHIANRLRERFNNIVLEPVPEPWLELLARLDRRERAQAASASRSNGEPNPA
jgi:hypothetical protein